MKITKYEQLQQLIEDNESKITPIFKRIESIALYNQKKVIDAFNDIKITDADLGGTNGYGYDDSGRDNLEAVYAHVFKTEDAIVRPQVISGTHAITLALSANLQFGDELLYITGQPYDTLLEVIGITGNGDGSVIETDLVVMAVGIRPVTKQARAAELEIGRGIVVNDFMQTSDPDVYAVGECAEHNSKVYGLVAPLYEQG